MRDRYVKDAKQKKKEKSGSGAPVAPPYIFSKQLIFLDPVVLNRKTTESMTSDNANDIEQEPSLSSAEGLDGTTTPKSSRRKRDSCFEDEMVKFMRIRTEEMEKNARDKEEHNKEEEKKNREDDVQQFWLSITPDIRALPRRSRLNFHIEVMQLLQKYQDSIETQGAYGTHHYSNSAVNTPLAHGFSHADAAACSPATSAYGQEYRPSPHTQAYGFTHGQVAACPPTTSAYGQGVGDRPSPHAQAYGFTPIPVCSPSPSAYSQGEPHRIPTPAYGLTPIPMCSPSPSSNMIISPVSSPVSRGDSEERNFLTHYYQTI